MRERSADIASADQRDFLASHGFTILSRRRGTILRNRILPYQNASQHASGGPPI
jgi:hypothetical protein